MLYIWPFIVFFSLPLLYPYLLQMCLPRDFLLATLPKQRRHHLLQPRLKTMFLFMTTSLFVVGSSTEVHPFTLADNRHYMFYVFRHLLRHPAIKYAALPAYFAGALAVFAFLEDLNISDDSVQAKKPDERKDLQPASGTDVETSGLRVSWIMIWLGTTALSLCTAPLVEPRYFIIPWLMWRLHVPVASTKDAMPKERQSKTQHSDRHDHRLWLETAWFLAINSITCYIFIYRGFGWKQEPGKVQRFMW